MNENERNFTCRNCQAPIYVDSKYCSQCGQKNTDGRIKLWDFFSEFFSSIFNLDTQLFRSLQALLIPGRLTNDWFQGKHKSYLHPLRFFIVSILFLLAVVFSITGGDDMTLFTKSYTKDRIAVQVTKNDFRTEIDSLVDEVKLAHPDPNAQIAFDSLEVKIKNNFKQSKDSLDLSDFVILWNDSITNIVSKKDFIDLDIPELCDKYQIEGFRNRLEFGQKIKVLRDNNDFAKFALSNLTWVMLFMMPILALLLQLIYIRKKMYYVEHLIFSFHNHTFAFLALFVAFLLQKWTGIDNIALATLFLIFVYVMIALKKVYQQSWRATIFWGLLMHFIYIFIFFFSFIFGLLIGMFLF